MSLISKEMIARQGEEHRHTLYVGRYVVQVTRFIRTQCNFIIIRVIKKQLTTKINFEKLKRVTWIRRTSWQAYYLHTHTPLIKFKHHPSI